MSIHDEQSLHFSDLLRRARRVAGLTQEELAERAGLSTRGISDLERGIRRVPHQDTLEMLSDALNLTDAERTRWTRLRRQLAMRSTPETVMSSRMSYLPNLLTPFIGREREGRELGALLRDPAIRLVTLTGVGGTGKTRLSIAVAGELTDAFPGGAHFVDLASIRNPALVVPAIARILSVNEAGDQALLDTLVAFIADRRMLLILDNFEQVVDAARDVGAILSRCPQLCVLATSRVPLRLSGEQEYMLAPLHVPGDTETADLWQVRESEAVELFVQRARATNSSFELTQANAEVVAAICRRLDGLPLAIELAAARIRVLSPHDILARLEHPLALLIGGARDLPARQRTIRDTIRWSYELLEPDVQTMFRRLSAFVGGWTLEAAEAVAQSDGDLSIDALDGLTSLVESNLVIRTDRPDGESRFTMLEMVREFGLEQIESLGESRQVFQRHAGFIVELAEEAEPAIRDERQPDWFARLISEQGNIRAVLQRSLADGEVEVDLGRRLAVALVWYWFMHNHFREARDWLRLAAFAPGTGADVLWARASVGLGMMRWRLREVPEARRHVSAGLEVLRQTGDHWHTLFALHQLAHLADETGEPTRALELFQESMDGYREIGDEWGVAFAHCCLGRTLVMQGRSDEARVHLLESSEKFQALGDGWFAATAHHRLGDVEFGCGHFDESERWYRMGLRRSAEIGDEIGVADVLVRLGQISVALQQPERAARLLGAARAIHDAYNMALFGPLRPAYEEVITSISVSLGQERFAERWEEGRGMPLDGAVEYALDAGGREEQQV
jgi:predicted ATPase/transcriptional regulator with XRE-family HTH domain